MNYSIITLLILMLSSVTWSQNTENLSAQESLSSKLDSTKSENQAIADSLLNDTTNIVKAQNTNFDEIDILSDNELRSFFLFVDDFNESDESIKEIIEERDLARDEFLMQNIDREEFEQERILLIFKNKEEKNDRKTYGVLKVTGEDFKPAPKESSTEAGAAE